MADKIMHSILIVDDSPDDIELTRRILLRCGHAGEVKSAARGEAALNLLRNTEDLPALIILDMKMPGMSGVDTLSRIRAEERLKHIPVIILTNSALESDRRNALAAGANSFINKAFDIDQFSKDMKSLLERWLHG